MQHWLYLIEGIRKFFGHPKNISGSRDSKVFRASSCVQKHLGRRPWIWHWIHLLRGSRVFLSWQTHLRWEKSKQRDEEAVRRMTLEVALAEYNRRNQRFLL